MFRMRQERKLQKRLLLDENKLKQQVVSRDKRKSKALLTWSDDEDSATNDKSSDEMVNPALIGLNDGDTVPGIIEEGFVESDFSNLTTIVVW